MNSAQTLIFQHLHRTGGTLLLSIMRRFFSDDSIYRIDEFRNGERYSVKYFLGLAQSERDKIKLLRGHMPFGLHVHFSHPCDYITILRDPVERIISEYSRLRMWPPDALAAVKNSEKIRGISFEDFVESDFAAVNDYQTRVFSGNWTGQYEDVAALEESALEEAKGNLRKYFKVVGVTEKMDETILVLAGIFGWKNPYYSEKKHAAKRGGIIPQEGLERYKEILRAKNKLDIELHRFAGKMLEESIMNYGPNFKRDLRRFKYMNNFLGRLFKIGRYVPSSLRHLIKSMLPADVFSSARRIFKRDV